MFGQNNNLPFSADRADGMNYIRNTHEFPNLNVDLGQNMNPYGFDCMQALIVEIQNNAESNPLRVFAYNLFSDNRFANDPFVEVLRIFASRVEGICLQRQGMDPRQVIQSEVGEVVRSATGYLVKQFPALQRYLPTDNYGNIDREAVASIETAIRNWEYLIGEFQAMHRPQGFGNSGYNRGYQSNNGPMDFRPSWSTSNRSDNGQGMGGRAVYSAGPTAPGRSGFGAAPAQVDMRPSWETSGSTLPEPNRTAPISKAYSSPMRPQPQPYAPPAKTLETRPLPTRSQPFGNLEGSAMDKTYPQTFTVGGNTYELAKSLNQTAVDHFGTGRPIVDITKDAVVVERDAEGKTAWAVIEGGGPVDYLKHEHDRVMREFFQETHPTDEGAVEPVNILATRSLVPNQRGSVATHVDEEERKALDDAHAPRKVITPMVVGSLAEARLRAQVEGNRLAGNDGKDDGFLEYVVEEVSALAAGEEATKAVLSLRQARGLVDFRDRIKEAHAKGDISEALYDILKARCNVAFRRYCQSYFLFTEWADDFMEDVEDLINVIERKYGKRVRELFEQKYRLLIHAVTSVLTGESLKRYLSQIPQRSKAYSGEPAVFVERYSVTEVPYSAQAIAKRWGASAGTVNETRTPELKKALDAIFSRTDANDVMEHAIVSTDGYPFHFYRSPFDPDSYSMNPYYKERVSGSKVPTKTA